MEQEKRKIVFAIPTLTIDDSMVVNVNKRFFLQMIVKRRKLFAYFLSLFKITLEKRSTVSIDRRYVSRRRTLL